MLSKTLLTAAIAMMAMVLPVAAQTPPQGLKILIPSDDSCTAFVTAMNAGDTAAMLNLGGWALGYWSALAVQTGKDILRNTTSQALLDRLATECQAQPNAPMTSIVAAIGRSLLSGLPE
jgi:hypothetical protein